jgi:hypothetical protein
MSPRIRFRKPFAPEGRENVLKQRYGVEVIESLIRAEYKAGTTSRENALANIAKSASYLDRKVGKRKI